MTAALACGAAIPAAAASAAPRHHVTRPSRHHLARHDRSRSPLHLGGDRWVTAWAASPQVAAPAPGPGNLSLTGFDDQTDRNIVFSGVSGHWARVRFTNTFGDQPLQIGAAAIALAGAGGATVPGTNMPLTFAGQPSIVIPAGAEALSDPVRIDVPALGDLAVSVYLPAATGPATQHSDAQQVNYVASGNHALDSDAGAYTTQTQSWYFVDAVDVAGAPRTAGTLVAFGDSITDGFHSTVNANARWPNDLSRRLDARWGETLAVADEGISGDRVLSSDQCCGENAIARFDRDVVDRAGAREVILLMGINDIGFSVLPPGPTINPTNPDVSAADIIGGYEQIIAQAHAAGLKIFGATLTPFVGASYETPAGEGMREAVNRWILTSGAFDGVIDFARAVADPSNPTVMNPAYDSGDHLHPNDAGYQAMANAIPLWMLLDLRHGE